jgi:putative phosphoesterase
MRDRTMSAPALRVGLISDTHGLLRPEALAALNGCDRIVHAGDIGNPEILRRLAGIAPVTAVRGNNDHGAWAKAIPETEVLQLGETYLYVLHDLHDLDIDPAAAGLHAVVAGHSHRPQIEHRHGVLFVNPGSAGPRRFRLRVTVAELAIDENGLRARVIDLPVDRQL